MRFSNVPIQIPLDTNNLEWGDEDRIREFGLTHGRMANHRNLPAGLESTRLDVDLAAFLRRSRSARVH